MKGVYQHCGEAHLHRYIAELTFRYNRRSAAGIEDGELTEIALRGIRGKCFTFRRTDEAPNTWAAAAQALPQTHIATAPIIV